MQAAVLVSAARAAALVQEAYAQRSIEDPWPDWDKLRALQGKPRLAKITRTRDRAAQRQRFIQRLREPSPPPQPRWEPPRAINESPPHPSWTWGEEEPWHMEWWQLEPGCNLQPKDDDISPFVVTHPLPLQTEWYPY
ncbi:hypothetical protein FB451DRAFT_1392222 [Mycena latifolia]|nr:hypothetical protein FB451DRAFT_1392222 [Mycena latifolia]